MIKNFNNKNKKDDIKILSMLVFCFLVAVWLCTPPGNKFAQICFYGNNTQHFIAKMTKPQEELNEWKFHRNNAVYLARMERKSSSLEAMDKAIKTLPSYMSEGEVVQLYYDRANLRLFWGDYKGALDDYLKVTYPGIIDKFKIALLYKKAGNNKYALSYCNSILETDPQAYVGYACIAHIYAGVGRYTTSVRVYDLLIDRSYERARYYADRAVYKKKAGDISGYHADMNKAKSLTPNIEEEITIIQETLSPKRLNIGII